MTNRIFYWVAAVLLDVSGDYLVDKLKQFLCVSNQYATLLFYFISIKITNCE